MVKYIKELTSAILQFLIGWIDSESSSTNVDICLEWNKVILEANILDHGGCFADRGPKPEATQGPLNSAHAQAIAHMAMFEAYNGIVRKYDSMIIEHDYIDCEGASMDVAVATAVRNVMVGMDGHTGLYHHNEGIMDHVNFAYGITLSRAALLNDDPLAKAKGITCGHQVAIMVMEDRADDGYMPDNAFLVGLEHTASNEPGTHKKDPLNPDQPFYGKGASYAIPFTMDNDEMKIFRPAAPPGWSADSGLDQNDARYVECLEGVKIMGADRGGEGPTISTKDESYIIGNFWSANGSKGTGTPIALYFDISRKIAIERGNTLDKNMLLFSMLSMTIAEAAISTWDSKWYYNFWRPVVAIREHPNVEIREEGWKPLGASRSNGCDGEHNFSPYFPSHASGHATFGCTAMQMNAHIYETYDIPITYTSVEWNGITLDQDKRTRPCLERSFTSLKDVMAENAVSRVFNGVHFDFEGEFGCEAGMKIADYVWKNKYLPLRGKSHRHTQHADDIPLRIKDKIRNVVTTGYKADTCDVTPPYPYFEVDEGKNEDFATLSSREGW